jgi:hypothetical protein
VGSETAKSSGIGNPLCQFVPTGPNTGVAGTVSVTIDASVSPATFVKTKQQLAGATTVSGFGDAAFYLPSTATLHFLKGRNAGVIQVDFRVPHGMPRNPSQVQADSVVLAKAIAADLYALRSHCHAPDHRVLAVKSRERLSRVESVSSIKGTWRGGRSVVLCRVVRPRRGVRPLRWALGAIRRGAARTHDRCPPGRQCSPCPQYFSSSCFS